MIRHLNTMSQGWLSVQSCSVCGPSEVVAPRKTHWPEVLVGRNFDSLNPVILRYLFDTPGQQKVVKFSRKTHPMETLGVFVRRFPPHSHSTCESGSSALHFDCVVFGRGGSVYSVILEKVVLSRWCFVLWTGSDKMRQRPARR